MTMIKSRAESAVEDQKQRLTQVRNQHELALANLRTALLLPCDAPINLQGEFFDFAMQPETGSRTERHGCQPAALESEEQRECEMLGRKIGASGEISANGRCCFCQYSKQHRWYFNKPPVVYRSAAPLNLLDGGLIHAQAAALVLERCKVNIEYDNTANDTRFS